MITYLCEDTPEGIFTAVYDAWAAKIPDDRLHLMTEQEMNFSLFTEYRQVETDQEKAVKVARSIRQKIANEAYIQVYYASLSNEGLPVWSARSGYAWSCAGMQSI